MQRTKKTMICVYMDRDTRTNHEITIIANNEKEAVTAFNKVFPRKEGKATFLYVKEESGILYYMPDEDFFNYATPIPEEIAKLGEKAMAEYASSINH